MNTLISVIIPIYNVELWLNRCIQSVCNQTYSNLEIILVDDGSPDNCPILCDQWAVKDNRIRVIHKTNGGLSDARNAGLKIATGEYIGFVDSDDWIAAEMYEKLLYKAEKDRCDITACAVQLEYEDGTPVRSLTHNSREAVYSREQAMEELLRERELLQPVWYKLYKTDTIKDLLFPTGKLHEDVYWSYQAIGAASRIGIICDIGYYYWQRSGSIMSERYSLRRLDAIEARVLRQQYLLEKFPTLSEIGMLELWFNCMYQGQLALHGLNDKKELDMAFRILNRALKQFKPDRGLISKQSATHQVWLRLAQHSLKMTCCLRNAIKIGL